jgi:hypothetical protein
MSISVIIPHFFHSRVKNLPKIVNSLRDEVDEVLVWNNDEPIAPVDGATILQAGKNWNCQGRFLAVESAVADYVLFHDNDLIYPPGSATALLENLIAQRNTAIVTAEHETRTAPDGTEVVVSRAQFELVPASVLEQVLWCWHPGFDSVQDDIWLSLSALAIGVPCVPLKLPGVKWREEKVGFRRSMTRAKWEAHRQKEFERLYAKIVLKEE